MDIKMQIIPEPAPGTASILQGIQVIIKGNGTTNYICGCCGKTICEKVNRGQIVNLVFKCANCNSFNIIRGT